MKNSRDAWITQSSGIVVHDGVAIHEWSHSPNRNSRPAKAAWDDLVYLWRSRQEHGFNRGELSL